MKLTTRPQATLVDLLDRVLDRGLVIDADIIVCLAGVPLIGVKLRAALAGIETMVAYGLMKESDLGIRSQTTVGCEGSAAPPAALWSSVQGDRNGKGDRD